MSDYPLIQQLLPHDEPMILIDRAVDIQQDSIHCQVQIGQKNPFFNAETNSIPAYVGIEFMAQSIAAWSGYHAIQQGQAPAIGFLLGSRRYVSHYDAFQQNQVLDIHAEKLMEDNGMAVFTARIELDTQVVATCQLNVYVPSEEKLKEMKIRSQQ
ncbi:3-hydroxydecanoyl-ACP dehydratase [Vibrio sp. UCD-FRSSP16_10]|uniref:hotdog family protein n=1 Tax=unclassified Vibrio TaxID=2614977 RepID=UPI0007FFB159|nr:MULTISPECIES: hotdog family protein [unclassified Vibrio]OBT14769.1 3-hydroxydecanoyl-ACP dehydratase [Vibrio sp. UCD-FRSSP16_30]OBT20058.1 3-hydroxydecanoyl-ACP dehydratase [Vibrio sp. UCD-FRSSP16_10]